MRIAELEIAASTSATERERLEGRIVELEALTIAASPVPPQPASALVAPGLDEGVPGQSMAPAVDAEQDVDEESFGLHQMKVVPIAAAIRAGVAAIAPDSEHGSDAERLEYWIARAAQRDATALYLRAGHIPLVRVRQRLQPLDDQELDRSTIDRVTAALTIGENDWSPVSDAAWTRELDGIGRATCQAFIDDCGTGLVVHLSRGAASILCKDIPRQVRRVCEEDHGLVIVSAPALPDVMQMVAALGEWTAQRRAGYLISIEPPSGLGHDISGMLVSARRIAGSERDVAGAIRRAMHEGPDVLVIALASGLIADEAIRAAQSGCLVIVGVIAPTGPRAVETLLSSMHVDRGQPVRRALAASFRCGFSYRALPGRDGARAIVQDLLIGTSDIRACLERDELAGLEGLQRAGSGGMRSLDAALAGAVHRRQAAHRRNRAARGQSGSSDANRVVAGVRA
jgi:twitching motility protein PilT